MMHYVIVLGDLFDRGGDEADPVSVYFILDGLQGKGIKRLLYDG